MFERAVEACARHVKGEQRWQGPGVIEMARAWRSMTRGVEKWDEWARSVPGGEKAAARLLAELRGGGTVQKWRIRVGATEWRHQELEEFGRAVHVAGQVAVEFGRRGQGPGGEGWRATVLKRYLEWAVDEVDTR